MASRLPPLNAVRAFAAAAQHLSFSRAAAELHVTHGAVSRQIKALEQHLGAALFERRVRQVLLTAAGQQFYAEVAPALAQIAGAAQAVALRAPARAVRINVRPSFAVRWLIPRLPAFVARYPGVEPQVVTSTADPARAADDFDVAIRRGLEGWDRLPVQAFLEDEALIVGAPSLFAAHPVREPRDLARHTLLISRTRRQDWDDWKLHAGSARTRPASRLQFDHLHFVLQAALDGLGFAVAPLSLVSHDLAAARLTCPLPQLRLPLARHYYALAPNAAPESHCFTAWLEGEMGAAPQAAANHSRAARPA
ncbi:MAG TPA: transcriptional regulator GcvA [Burkholderiales bacterium]